MERIYPTKEDINRVLASYRIENHIERYQIVKRYCYGLVLDIACGVGYGSHLLSNNPDIEHVIGVDINEDTIDFAVNEYASDKVTFLKDSISDYNNYADTLVSLETIEHMDVLMEFRDMVYRVEPSVLILSFPNKKSTHFNPYHKHDLNTQQVMNLMDKYIVAKKIFQHDVTILVMTRLSEGIPRHLFATLD